MNKTLRFGGLRLKENRFSANAWIEKTHLPRRVYIPLLQHSGKPAKICVQKDQLVEEGQLIGSADGNLSCPVHASVSGRVISIASVSDHSIVTIETGGSVKNWYAKKTPLEQLAPKDMIERIRAAGVVRLNGESVSEASNLEKATGSKIQTLILSCFQTEPYLASVYRMSLEKCEEVLEALNVYRKMLSVQNAVLVFSELDLELIALYTEKAKGLNNITILPIHAKYPQDEVSLLVQTAAGKEIPLDKNPWDIGCYAIDVETLMAGMEAVLYQKPLIERIVSFTGDGLNKAVNLKVRIGTSISYLIEEYGLPAQKKLLAAGGPMRGEEITDRNKPITKYINSVIFLSPSKKYVVSNDPCIRCGSCVELCPVRIDVPLLSRLCELGRLDEAVGNGLSTCVECGLCAYDCPSRIPIVGFIKRAKKLINSEN